MNDNLSLFQCDCGSVFTKHHYAYHVKNSKKHLHFLSTGETLHPEECKRGRSKKPKIIENYFDNKNNIDI